MRLLCSNLRYCVCVCLEALRKAFVHNSPSPGPNLNPEPFENEPGLLTILQWHWLKGYSVLNDQTHANFIGAFSQFKLIFEL